MSVGVRLNVKTEGSTRLVYTGLWELGLTLTILFITRSSFVFCFYLQLKLKRAKAEGIKISR